MAKINMAELTETARANRDIAERDAAIALSGGTEPTGVEKKTSFIMRMSPSRKARFQKLARDISKLTGRRVSLAEVIEMSLEDFEAKWRRKNEI